MPDYNLNGLDHRSFEHIVQAIAKKEIGNGVTPFGDGPDGGREATFSGKMNYPSITAPWEGYLVIQSKFEIHPTGNPKDDGDWLIAQLDKDLAKFSDKKRSLKRPEYYLATTNIRLSAVSEKGTRDRIDVLLQDAGKSLGLKGHGVWAYDDLCRFLDNNHDVRKAYSHLITSGDVLGEIHESLDLFKNVGARKTQMSQLIERFKKERENDEMFSGIIAKLQHYSSSTDGVGDVEGVKLKLGKAGYDNLLEFALMTKELFVKKLTEFQFSKSAQEMQCLLLAEVYTRFHHCVWPALCEGRSQEGVQDLVQTHIINPVSEMLGENVLDIYTDELTGMLYFLTGNCHIRWTLT
jgi:hypothetical protein